MITKKNIQEIKKLGITIDHDMAFGGKSKGNKHLFRVVAIAKHLALKTNADILVVEAGAWLHDTALPSGDDYNYKNNKEILLNLLSRTNISAEDKNLISECVASHEGTKIPKTLEAKIVHDADVLEKVGLLGIIRHTWKLTNLEKINPNNITDRDVKKIIEHIEWRGKRLQTSGARKIQKYLTVPIKIDQAKTLISLISEMADKGIVTEKIAMVLSKHLNKRQNEKLTEQLSLRYLPRFK